MVSTTETATVVEKGKKKVVKFNGQVQGMNFYPSPESAKIQARDARFPYCIVWTPLPLITWLIPCIGHTGIALSQGVIHDFAGPFTIGIDNLAFGETHKYVRLHVEEPIRYD
mmetsp:Transcript_46429/g.34104  ORF Transcript_46429/g.34104 Transcript_46429/m.34104 type:complete len:112 (+) Transcript_46429:43-378(+)